MTRRVSALAAVLLPAVFLFVLPASPAVAQGASPAIQKEVDAFMRKYVEVANKADVNGYLALYKQDPNLLSITDGEITRGWSSLRDTANQLIGKEGSYKLSIGAYDVMALGANRVLVAGPHVLIVTTEAGPEQADGAFSFILEKIGGKWLIVHEHDSYQGVDDADGD